MMWAKIRKETFSSKFYPVSLPIKFTNYYGTPCTYILWRDAFRAPSQGCRCPIEGVGTGSREWLLHTRGTDFSISRICGGRAPRVAVSRHSRVSTSTMLYLFLYYFIIIVYIYLFFASPSIPGHQTGALFKINEGRLSAWSKTCCKEDGTAIGGSSSENKERGDQKLWKALGLTGQVYRFVH